MELITKYIFALFWLFVAVYLTYLDKEYPESQPTDDIVYWIVWWYIAFVFAWPRVVGDVIEKVVTKISDFSINFKKDE